MGLEVGLQRGGDWTNQLGIAVNVSAVQLHSPHFPQLVHEALFQTGLAPHRLELEITETALIRDLTRALSTLPEGAGCPHRNGRFRHRLGLGKGLNLPVLAEGVETKGELQVLNMEACTEAQGYLLGRPQPIDKFSGLVDKSGAPRAEDEAELLRAVG